MRHSIRGHLRFFAALALGYASWMVVARVHHAAAPAPAELPAAAKPIAPSAPDEKHTEKRVQPPDENLPPEAYEQLEQLRRSALEFVEAVRDSGADIAMLDAESGLAEFAGTRGHADATRAAEILESFISKCESIGGKGGQGALCLRFQPSLSQCMGDSVAQMLAEMGMGSGAGGAGGGTGGGGFSARRGPGVGLYGSMPTLGGGMTGGGQGGDGDSGDRSIAGAPSGEQGTLADVPAQSAAAGASQFVVPPRYRQRVGQYFERLADELNK